MTWHDVRSAFPHQWLLVEAVKAHSESDHRILDDLSVVDTCPDSPTAMKRYADLHREAPARELYVLHTDRAEPDIEERFWIGLRPRW